jgi:hypothetical protein
LTRSIRAMNRGTLSDPLFISSTKRHPIKKEAIPKNTKGLTQKITNEKGGNPEKYKGAHSKDIR